MDHCSQAEALIHFVGSLGRSETFCKLIVRNSAGIIHPQAVKGPPSSLMTFLGRPRNLSLFIPVRTH